MDKAALSIKTATRLKELRKSRGLSHEKLREKLYELYGIEISRASLMNYEVANENHSRFGANCGMQCEYIQCFSDFYGVSADYILGLSDVKSSNPDVRSVCEYTGLGEEAISNIRNESHDAVCLKALNDFLSIDYVLWHRLNYMISCAISRHPEFLPRWSINRKDEIDTQRYYMFEADTLFRRLVDTLIAKTKEKGNGEHKED